MQRRTIIIVAGLLVAAGGAAAIAAVGSKGGWRRGAGGMDFMMDGDLGGGMRFAGRLKRLDANSDGAVSLDEVLARSEPRFLRIDANKDGAIDTSEVEAQVKERVDYWAKRITRRLDANRDGRIDRDEFQRPMRDRFAERDLNDDGQITDDDLPPGMRGRGEPDADDKGVAKEKGKGGRGWGRFSLDRLLGRGDAEFKRMDANADGVIDAGEAQAQVGERVAYWTKRFLHRFDQNRDGRVGRDEFDRLAKERFALADLNDDGKITSDDLPPGMRERAGLR